MKKTKLETGLIKIEPEEGKVLSNGLSFTYGPVFTDPRNRANEWFDIDSMPDFSEIVSAEEALDIIMGGDGQL